MTIFGKVKVLWEAHIEKKRDGFLRDLQVRINNIHFDFTNRINSMNRRMEELSSQNKRLRQEVRSLRRDLLKGPTP